MAWAFCVALFVVVVALALHKPLTMTLGHPLIMAIVGRRRATHTQETLIMAIMKVMMPMIATLTVTRDEGESCRRLEKRARPSWLVVVVERDGRAVGNEEVR